MVIDYCFYLLLLVYLYYILLLNIRELFANKHWLYQSLKYNNWERYAWRRILTTPGWVGYKNWSRVPEARQTAVEDDDSEDEVEFDEDVVSFASQSVSQNGGSNCSHPETAITVRNNQGWEGERSGRRVKGSSRGRPSWLKNEVINAWI